MKKYVAKGGFRQGAVLVIDDDKTGPLKLHARHSPTGHAWGYGGSGPAQLALDVLWDFLAREPSPTLYQAFKTDVIAPLDQSAGFTITTDQIAAWLEGRENPEGRW